MNPAEKRVKDLIDRWLASLDLHLQYVDLKDSAYNNVQPWPVHDRPTRWILELAKQKTLELQAAFESRLAMGDAKFAESMELMVFLATLVGIQHVQRYIPLADPEHHGQVARTELDAPKSVATPAKTPVTTSTTATIEATIAMPPRARAPSAPSAPIPAQTIVHAKSATPAAPKTAASSAAGNVDDDATREMPRANRAAAPSAKQPVTASAAKPTTPASKPNVKDNIQTASELHNLVIADAVRLLNWGKRWHELAELIARIADRPKLPEVRRILRSHRAAIEMRAAAETEAEEEKEREKK